MNEILYADSDTNHFKMIDNKVWVLAPQSISQSSGSAKQISLPNALRSAIRFKHTDLKKTRRTVRFVRFGPNRPKMVQKTAQTSQPSSLSKAIKKAIQIKNGRCQETIGSKTIEGAMVWSLTPDAEENPKTTKTNSFLAGLKQLKKQNEALKNKVIEKAPPQVTEQEKLIPVVVSVSNPFQAMPISA